jgi:hypothetical protein
MSESTIPEIFIIESLRIKDEANGHQEGQLLSKMLHLSGKEKTKYFYIRTKKELDEIIDLFERQQLPLSASVLSCQRVGHGDHLRQSLL